MQRPLPRMFSEHSASPAFCLAFSYSSFTFQLKYSFPRETFHDAFRFLSLFSSVQWIFQIKMCILHSMSLTSAGLLTPGRQRTFLFCPLLYLWSQYHGWHSRCPNQVLLNVYIHAAAAHKGGEFGERNNCALP